MLAGDGLFSNGRFSLRKILLAAFIGAVVQMVWGWLFWGALPFSKSIIQTAESEDAIREVVDANLKESGVYFMPYLGAYDVDGQAAFQQKHESGPIVTVFFRKEGAPVQSPSILLKGFFHVFVSVLLLLAIMSKAMPRLPSYWSRVMFIFLMGIFAAFYSNYTNSIWWYVPWSYSTGYANYHIVAWLLTGLAIAPVVKPRTTDAVQASSSA